jgi:hypothetical protein
MGQGLHSKVLCVFFAPEAAVHKGIALNEGRITYLPFLGRYELSEKYYKGKNYDRQKNLKLYRRLLSHSEAFIRNLHFDKNFV